MKMNRRTVVIAGITLLLSAIVLVESQTHFVQRSFDDIVLDNRGHYLECDELPTQAEVDAVMKTHQDVIREIEEINPGLVGVYSDSGQCLGKADIVFFYGSHEDRLKIERLIGSDTFFGIPYRLRNQ